MTDTGSAEDGHHSALEGDQHILSRRHGDDDRNIHGRPEGDPAFSPKGHQAAFVQIVEAGDEQHHRKADAADVGLDANQGTQRITDDDAKEIADGKQRCSENHHDGTANNP